MDGSKRRLRLILLSAGLVGCAAATLSGSLSADARPLSSADPLHAAVPQPEPSARCVVTVGMLMAEHPPV